MKRYILLILTFLSVVARSQNITTIHTSNDLSPSANRFAESFLSLEDRLHSVLEQTSCFYSVQKLRGGADTADAKAVVSTWYSSGNSDGDFLPYEGNGSYDAGVQGFGVMDYGDYGILHGKAFYGMGEHRGISWNAMRFPELYMPYIITDSTGGDSRFETYCAEGGYSNVKGRILWSADFSFRGEQAYRLTDPRVLNNVTFLTFKSGLGYLFDNGSVLSADVYYVRNKQYEHDRYWRPGEQQRFFVLYGFGLYNNKQSIVAFGVSRMYYVNNPGCDITYVSPKGGKMSLEANLTYDFKYMYTEESSIVKLFNSRTHTINPTFCLTYTPIARFRTKLYGFNSLLYRSGVENITERYVTDVATSSYDYRKIAEEHNYYFMTLNSHTALSFEFDVTQQLQCGFQSGVSIYKRHEQNTKYDYNVENLNIMPHIGLKCKVLSRNKRHEFDMQLQYSRQKALKNSYDVEIQNTTIPHLDFQTCFAPYAYYSSETNGLYGQLTYAYHLKKFAAGIAMRGFYVTGQRVADAEYAKTIGYNSICSMISPFADVHNETWFNLATFILF